ncbi:MAG TPA: hypothetical protein VE136_05930 [Anaerolineales bacterium]|nr:hypothetical protein [Anaerolineales bacterium]
MRLNDPDKQFENVKRFRRAAIFAAIVAMTIAVIITVFEGFPWPEHIYTSMPLRIFDGLYFGVLVLLAVTLLPVFLLIALPNLQSVHIAVRLDAIYHYLVYAWLVFFASRLMVSVYHGIYWFPEVLLRNGILGILLVVVHRVIKRRYTVRSETMFP